MKRFLIGLVATGLLLAANPIVEDAKKKIKDGKFDDAIVALDKEHAAKPKAADVTQALADAHVSYGDFYMNNAGMRPMVKYPSALKEYRKALEFDKNNKAAKENIATIEGIYKSMGRPVPQ